MDSSGSLGDALVIGVGNRWRRDDGAGLLVAEAVERLALPGVRVATVEGECYRLLDLWAGAGCVFVVDAARGPEAGKVYRLHALDGALPTDLLGASSHGFGVLHAVELSRALGRLPLRLNVYGVAGVDFGTGEGLSREATAAVAEAVDALASELRVRAS